MKTGWLTVLLLFFQTLGFSQSITDLQKKKQNAAKEIEYTSKLLNQVQQNEKSSLNKLQLINNQIKERNNIISSINEEINVYQEFINDHTLVIEMLGNDLQLLKNEYAEMIRSAYRNRNSYDKALFILSADNFNQAYRRYLYMKRYAEYRENQAGVIENIQEVLNQNSIKLEERKTTRRELMDETQKETEKLSGEKQLQNSEIQKLQKEQRSLRQKLEQQRKIEQQLEREIQRIIEEEATKTKGTGTKGFALTPEQKLVGDSFSQNKKRLPWPVERGIITEHFGIHSHAVLSNVQIRNNGINITTESGAKVRSVFNGEVTRVFAITGGNSAVIIRHGKYLSVYSNLREVTVKKGDKVATKQEIGTVYTDREDGNKSILKFQIWEENQKLDPEDWLGR